MKFTWGIAFMNLALWLVCVVPLFPQNAAPTQQHNGAAAVSDEKSRNARQLAMIDILTDPQGVNFGPYLQRILEDVKEHWHTPESFSLKKGIVVIRCRWEKWKDFQDAFRRQIGRLDSR